MKKNCAKCKTEFDCKADDIKNCLCGSVQLNANTLVLIKSKFDDCLCVECLIELNTKTTNEV